MKRLLLTSIVAIVCAVGFAQKVTIDKITYEIENGEASVRYADRDIEVANILSSVEYKGKSYPVTCIGKKRRVGMTWESGFLKCSKLKSVIIPTSVKTLGILAFAMCDNLEELSIPNSVEYFSPCCFSSTPFKKLIVPDIAVELRMSEYGGPFAAIPAKEARVYNTITEVICQNGSFPLWIMDYLPEKCPFVLAHKYQQGGNNNMYAQNPQPQPVQSTPQQTEKKPSSDVDVNLPSNAQSNTKTFAVIFANENYQEEVNVDYALNDGEMFMEYCQKVLGLPEKNIHIRKDATLNNIMAELSWMQQVAQAFKGQAKFIVFYAGHGIPDEASKAAYLLPVDGKGSMLKTGYSLAEFYKTLGSMPAERVTVFMDACFSGSKRGEGMLASSRGVAIKAKPQTPQGKMVVFSAASGDETAYPLKDKEHGLFTYYLLKKLKDTKGDVTYGELSNYINEQVSQESIVSNGKSQTPTVTPSQNVTATWKTMKLK